MASIKQKQRAKGNTRPSSSGRAADLLARDGSKDAAATASGFISFDAMSGDLGYIPAMQSASMEMDQDAALESDFRLVLRKLTKRDVITKLKAIQEFSTLCKEKDVETVKGTLPHWPRIYSRLSTDHDKRVREVTQQAFEQLIIRVRRNLAPHLRTLMGPWLLVQCDTYQPASLSARAAFHSAFPAAKKGEALVFCTTDVLKYLEDNLFKETATSLSDPKSYSPEEQEEKYLHIVTCSLLALAEFITALPVKDLPSISKKVSVILTEGKLWKFAKNKFPQLRSALYSFLGSVLRRKSPVASNHLARFSTTLLGSLDEPDPLAVQTLWESVLLLVFTFKDCWSHVNAKKAVLPKLWATLRGGGNGSAAVTYPNLLPFFSHIPSEVIGSGTHFYQEFLANIKEGLTCASAKQSTSECNAIVTAYMECLRYMVTQSIITDTDSREIVQKYLIQDQLIPFLAQSVSSKDYYLTATSLYPQTSKLLSHLYRQSNENSAPALCILSMFWNGLGAVCIEHVTSVDTSDVILEKTSKLLAGLRSEKYTALTKRSVSFSIDGSTPTQPTRSITAQSTSQVSKELASLVITLVCRSYKLARYEQSIVQLKFLARTFNSFPQAEVFAEILRIARGETCTVEMNPKIGGMSDDCELSEHQNSMESRGEEVDKDEIDTPTDGEGLSETSKARITKVDENIEEVTGSGAGPEKSLLSSKHLPTAEIILHDCFHKVLLPWIQIEEAQPESEALGYVVAIVVDLMNCCQDDQRIDLLDAFCRETKQAQTLYLLINKILQSSPNPASKEWLKSAVFGEKLIVLASNLCQQAIHTEADRFSSSHSWNLIKLGLTSIGEEPVIGTNFADKILCMFTDMLLSSRVKVQDNGESVHNCAALICDIATHFFSAVKGCLCVSSAEDLLLTLFQLDCEEASSFPEPLQQKIQCAWIEGTSCLVQQTRGVLNIDGFLCKAARWIKSRITEGPHTVNTITLLASQSNILLNTVQTSLASNTDREEEEEEEEEEIPVVAETLLGLLVPTQDEWSHSLAMPDEWKVCQIVNGYLTFSNLPELTLPDPVAMPTSLVFSVFVSTLLQPLQTASDCNVDDTYNVSESSAHSKNHERCVAVLPWQYDVIEPMLQRLTHVLQWCKGTMGTDTMKMEILLSNHGVIIPPYCIEVAMVINACLEDIWKVLTVEEWMDLVSKVLEMSLAEGDLWAVTLSHLMKSYYSLHKERHHQVDILQLGQVSDRFSELCPSVLHTVEAVMPYVTYDQALELMEINMAKLLSANNDLVTNINEAMCSVSVVAAVVRHRFDAANQSDLITGCIQQMMSWRENCPSVFLFGSELQDAVSCDKVFFNIKILKMLQLIVEKLPSSLSQQNWDFVLCSLCSWIRTCSDNIDVAQMMPVLTAFCCVTFDLLASTATLLGDLSKAETLPPNLYTEWREFFSDSVFSLLFPLFVKIVESTDCSSLSLTRNHLLVSASDAVRHIPRAQLKKYGKLLPPPRWMSNVTTSDVTTSDVTTSDVTSSDITASTSVLPHNSPVQVILARLCPMLLVTQRSVKIAVYQILETVVNEVAATDEAVLRDDNVDKVEDSSIPPPKPLKDILDSTSISVEVILTDVRIGDCLQLDLCSTDYDQSVSSVLTYLLVWRLYLKIFKAASAEVRAKYANYLRQTDSVDHLMKNIFRIMPDPPFIEAKSHQTRNILRENMFNTKPENTVKGITSRQDELHHQACCLYYSILEDLPAMVRQWWTSQDKKVAAIVDRFTSKYASPLLCAQEIRDVQTATQTYENMTVRARPATCEVIATYTMQDLSMDLMVHIPVNHPLGIITVDSEKKVGVGTMQWRNWTLQLTTFLRNQNGSIMDGLSLWKRNVDKRFEGVEDCMVCFSVIHGSNCSLPKLQCKTCKKRYHSACLYKWFSTSNQSTCPLCRSPY